MNGLTDDDLKALIAASEGATAGDLDTVPNPPTEYGGKDEDLWYDCPFCQGEGSVEGTTYCNFDRVAIGVQFFGIGDEPQRYEEYFRAIPPTVAAAMAREVLALREALDEIESQQQYLRIGGAYVDDTGQLEAGLERCVEIARAALEQKP